MLGRRLGRVNGQSSLRPATSPMVSTPGATCPVTAAGSSGRCNTIWYNAVFKGGVYDPRELVWAFCGADGRHVAPLEGGTVVACDRARLRQGAFFHSLSGGALRWVCSVGPAELDPRA